MKQANLKRIGEFYEVVSMPLRVIKKLLRYLFLLLIVVYFSVAGVLLISKYWFLPRIDNWRPEIEASLQDALGVKVELGEIKAQWQGLSPSFEVYDLALFDKQGFKALTIPKVDSVFSAWRSLTAFEPVFDSINIQRLAIVARRDLDGKIYAAGFELDAADDAQDNTDTPEEVDTREWFEREPIRWLLAQRLINLDNAMIVWIDQSRHVSPLKVENISASLLNRTRSHRIGATLTLDLPTKPTLEVMFRSARLGSVFGMPGKKEIDGQIYVNLNEFEPSQLNRWFDVPEIKGQFALRSWLDLTQGKLNRITFDMAGAGVAVDETVIDSTQIEAEQLALHLDSSIASFLSVSEYGDFVAKPITLGPANINFQAQDLRVTPPADMIGELKFETVALQSKVRRHPDQQYTVAVDQLEAVTPDGKVSLAGSWRTDESSAAGFLDASGKVSDFKLNRLYHYLPAEIGEDVLDWMRLAFLQGEVPQAAFVVKGPLIDFPFESTQEGVFTIDGSVRDWHVDYGPPEDTQLGWPAVTDLQGQFSLHQNLLSATTQGGHLVLPGQGQLETKRIEATIDQLYSEPVLELRASTESDGANYLTALNQTALSEFVPEMIRDLRGQGNWAMDLDLTLPLEDMEDVQFKTTLNLQGGRVGLVDLPMYEEVTGKFVVDNQGFSTEGLTGEMLGGKTTVKGSFGDASKDLKIEGNIGMGPLLKFAQMPSLNDWMRGTMPFNVQVKAAAPDSESLNIVAESSLSGVQLLFPEPLTLASGTALTTRLDWTIDPDSNSVGQGTLRLGDRIQIRGVGSKNGQPSVLQTVAIGVSAPPPSSNDGLNIAVKTPSLSASSWHDVYNSIAPDLDKMPQSSGPSLMPALRVVTLSSPTVRWDDTVLNQVQATLKVDAGDQYAADFESKQTSGQVRWKMRHGEVDGRMVAKLSRLHLGEDSPEKAQTEKTASPEKKKPELPTEETLSSVPPLDLIVDDLVLHGMDLGKLELKGQNQSNKKNWTIESLTLNNPDFNLSMTGQWRFEHKDPGMNGKVSLNVINLGEMLKRMGRPDLIRRGQGLITADIDWKNFPWFLDFENMNGKLQVDLSEGVFDEVNSAAARVLQLLSLQSFSRLLDFNASSSDTFGKGFPWSTIRGGLTADRGVISTNDLNINSPVANISFQGGTNLNTEILALSATIRPNLDLSGAAMATGFLMNPIIGLSALVGQYILKNPIEHMLSLHYNIVGPWADPQMIEAGETPDKMPESDKDDETTDLSSADEETQKQAQDTHDSDGSANSAEVEPQTPKTEVFRIELGREPELVEGGLTRAEQREKDRAEQALKQENQ